MTISRPWDNEAAGATLLVAQLGAVRAHRRDAPGGPPNTRDFDIELIDGSMIALEITQEVRPAILAQRAHEAKQNWTYPELSCHWNVNVREPCDLKPLRRSIVPVLVGLQDSGLNAWLAQRDRLDDDTEALLASLGVTMIYRLATANPGSVVIGSAAVAGSFASSSLIEVAERHANASDNRSKLRKAHEAAERHLLIWVLHDCHQVTAAMRHGGPPPRLPDLPDEIDVVWMATAYETPTVWRVDRAGWYHVTAKVEADGA